MRSKLFNIIIIIILLPKKNQKLLLQTATEKLSMKVLKPPQVPLKNKIKQKTSMSHKSRTSIKKLKRRPTTKTPSPKPEDKFQSKESSPMVTKPESLPLTKLTQLQLHQLLQPRLLTLPHQKRRKLLFKTQKTPTKLKLLL